MYYSQGLEDVRSFIFYNLLYLQYEILKSLDLFYTYAM